VGLPESKRALGIKSSKEDSHDGRKEKGCEEGNEEKEVACERSEVSVQKKIKGR
jgi:hypothetical protein